MTGSKDGALLNEHFHFNRVHNHYRPTVLSFMRALSSHQCGQLVKSRRRHHMWVEFVVGSLPCSERSFSRYSGFPVSSKTTFPNSNSTRNQVDGEPLSGCATLNRYLFYLLMYVYDGGKPLDWHRPFLLDILSVCDSREKKFCRKY